MSQNQDEREPSVFNSSMKTRVSPMRPKARGLAQDGGPPGWLEESGPDMCNFVRDGRAVLPAFSVSFWLF